MQNTQAINVSAGNATATGSVTVSDNMPGVPCPDPAGYKYVGARYVPLFADPAEWNINSTYEPLTIVINEGNSYTSKQFVPVGIQIDNEEYWALTGNYNAQVELYRQEVKKLSEQLQNKINSSSIKTLYDYEGENALVQFKNSFADPMKSIGGTYVTPTDSIQLNDENERVYYGLTIDMSELNGPLFIASNDTPSTAPIFMNCVFKGGTQPLIQGFAYHLTFIGCVFDNVIIKNDNYILQSPCFIGCTVTAGSTRNFITCGNIYDAYFSGCRFEYGSGYILSVNLAYRITFDGCLIEGRSTEAIILNNGVYSLSFHGCYFEKNKSIVVDKAVAIDQRLIVSVESCIVYDPTATSYTDFIELNTYSAINVAFNNNFFYKVNPINKNMTLYLNNSRNNTVFLDKEIRTLSSETTNVFGYPLIRSAPNNTITVNIEAINDFYAKMLLVTYTPTSGYTGYALLLVGIATTYNSKVVNTPYVDKIINHSGTAAPDRDLEVTASVSNDTAQYDVDVTIEFTNVVSINSVYEISPHFLSGSNHYYA